MHPPATRRRTAAMHACKRVATRGSVGRGLVIARDLGNSTRGLPGAPPRLR